MTTENTPIQVREELLLAKQSRLEGNEGRARVCARRAAGAAVKLFLDQKGLISKSESALQALIIFKDQADLPDRIQDALTWLVMRVSQEYKLPGGVDLINEAEIVLEYLEFMDPGLNSDA
jgi:hypothetical protein